MEEYIVELPAEVEKSCKLNVFLSALDFVREAGEFTTADLQRYLKCGYGTVTQVLDALCLLNAIEKISGPPRPIYRSVLK